MQCQRLIVVAFVFVSGVYIGGWTGPACERAQKGIPVDRAVVDELINNVNVADVNKGDESAGRMCMKLENVYPGVVSSKGYHRPLWRSDQCEISPMEKLNVRQCFAGMKQIWLGDSLTRDVARKIARFGLGMVRDMHFFTSEDKGEEYADVPVKGQVYSHVYPVEEGGKNGEFAFYWSAAALYDGSLNFSITQKAVKEADVVLVGSGMWDMGVLFIPPDSYFDVMRERLENIKKVMKPTAKLIVFPVHYLHIDRCPAGKRCRLCNDPDKAMVFREALSLAAACAGASVLDTAPITKASPLATNDGAHYDKFVSLMQADIYMNAVCRVPSMNLLRPSTCDPESAKARWRHYPTAFEGCKGPPVNPFPNG